MGTYRQPSQIIDKSLLKLIILKDSFPMSTVEFIVEAPLDFGGINFFIVFVFNRLSGKSIYRLSL